MTGIEKADIPQFSILGFETSIRLEELASGSLPFIKIIQLDLSVSHAS